MQGNEENQKGTATGWVLVVAISAVIAGALWDNRVQASEDVPVVPPEAVIEEVTEKSWFGNMKDKAMVSWNKKEILEQQLAELTALNEEFLVKQRHHDAIVDDLKAQADKNVEYLEDIVDGLKLELGVFSSKNEQLNSSIQDLQDKDNSLLFVEGCWVPLKSGQHTAQ